MTRPGAVPTEGRSDRRRSAQDPLYLCQETGSGTTGEGKFSLLHPGFVGRKKRQVGVSSELRWVSFDFGLFLGWFVICLLFVAKTGR